MSIGRLLFLKQCQIRNRLNRSIVNVNYVEQYSNVNLVKLFSSTSSKELINSKRFTNNIVNSPFRSVTGYENLLLHDIVWENMDKWWNKTAVECGITGRSYTYQQLREHSARLATSLRKMKLLQYDTVAIVLPNVPEYVIIALAAIEAGLRLTLINPIWTSLEMMKQFEHSETTAIFTNPLLYPIVKKSIENNRKIKLPIIVVNDGTETIPSNTINLNDLMNDGIEEFSKNYKTGVSSEDEVFLLYSSGTTGLPKGVQLTHRNVVANIFQVTCPELRFSLTTTETMQDIVPIILPLFHVYGLVIILLSYLRVGAKLICLPKFTVENYINILENYKPTLMYLVPPIVEMMTNNEQITSRHVEHIRVIVSGAAPLGTKSIVQFQERFSDKILFVQGYGLTETSPVITLSKTAPSDSVGFPVPNTQLRIVQYKDNKSINVGPNEIGEIYMKGPQLMKGYYKNPQATQETKDGDWFKTGDLGKYDKSGCVYIEGRSKELIKVKGFQVSPAELEDIIKSYNGIADAAVIGIPHDKYGEIPKAFIVLKKGVTIDPEDVKNYVAKQVADYKRIGQIQYIESIPKSAAGKILKKLLQNM